MFICGLGMWRSHQARHHPEKQNGLPMGRPSAHGETTERYVSTTTVLCNMTDAVYEEERAGVYPGSFDPPTIAHLGIAVLAKRAANLGRIDLVVSEQALAKEDADHAPFDTRIAVIEASIAHAPWLNLVVTDKQLIVDIAAGYDAVLMGADKYAQICEVQFYADEAARDAAIEALPTVVGPNRPGAPDLPDSAVVLTLPPKLLDVSSSGARSGRPEWMTPPARKTAEANSIWGL